MDNDQQNQKKLPKVSFFRYLLPLIFIVLAVAILLLKISNLDETSSVLLSMSPWLVFLAFMAQICSYLSSGYFLKTIMNLGQSQLSVFRGTLITMSAETIGLAGGLAASAPATYYWVSKDSDDSGEAVLAGILPLVYNSVVLISITIMGMLYLLFENEISRPQFIVYGSIMAVIMAGDLLIFYGLSHREKVEQIFLVTARVMTRFFKRTYNLSVICDLIRQFYDGLKLVSERGWIKLGLGPVMNTSFDILTLYTLFIAAGYTVKPSVLIAGYSLSFLLGRGVFFIPGGSGVIEGGMVAIYTYLGIPAHIGIVVVLGYRFLSFWMPSLLGFASMIYLQRTSGHHKR
jgi:uncharacterized protein (TIRG00374 family)